MARLSKRPAPSPPRLCGTRAGVGDVRLGRRGRVPAVGRVARLGERARGAPRRLCEAGGLGPQTGAARGVALRGEAKPALSDERRATSCTISCRRRPPLLYSRTRTTRRSRAFRGTLFRPPFSRPLPPPSFLPSYLPRSCARLSRQWRCGSTRCRAPRPARSQNKRASESTCSATTSRVLRAGRVPPSPSARAAAAPPPPCRAFAHAPPPPAPPAPISCRLL